MKIVFVTDFYYPQIGGVEIQTRRLAQILSELGHQVWIITASETKNDTVRFEGSLNIVGIGSYLNPLYKPTRFVIPVSTKKKISRILKEIKPDVIHIQTGFYLAHTAARYAKKYNIPSVATGHYAEGELENKYKILRPLAWTINHSVRSAYKSVWEKVDVITVPSDFSRGYFSKRMPESMEILTVSNGIDIQSFTSVKLRRAKMNTKTVLFVGRLEPSKNVEFVIRAMSAVIKRIDARLVVVGDGSGGAEIKRLTKQLKLMDRVIFTGHLEQEEVVSWYKKADVFVTASVAENQPLTVLEAIACGLPVVANTTGGIPELVLHGKNGYLISGQDEDELAQYILRVLKNDTLACKMGRESLKIARKHDIKKAAFRNLSLYQKAIFLCSQKNLSGPKSEHKRLVVKILIGMVLITVLIKWMFVTPSVTLAKSMPIKERIKNSKLVRSIEKFDYKIKTSIKWTQ